MSRNGAITTARSRCPPASSKTPPAEYHRAPRGLRSRRSARPMPMRRRPAYARGWPVAYDPKAGTANLTALLRQRRGRPRPVARHRHGRRAVRGHRPRPAPARPGDRGRRPGGRAGSSICRACRAGPRRSASTRSARRDVPIASVTAGVDAARRASGRGSNICDETSASFARWLQVRKNRRGRISTSGPPAGSICAMRRCRSGQSPEPQRNKRQAAQAGLSCVAVAMLDDRRAAVRAHAGFGQRQRGRCRRRIRPKCGR